MNYMMAKMAGAAPKVKEAMERLSSATGEHARIDAATEILELVSKGQNKKLVGEQMHLLLAQLDTPDERDEFRPLILDVINLLISVEGMEQASSSKTANGAELQKQQKNEESGPTAGLGLGGRGAATFEWLQVPMANADVLLKEGDGHVGMLLGLLHTPGKWTRLGALRVLLTLFGVKPKEAETAVVMSQSGMLHVLELLGTLDDCYTVEAFMLMEKLTFASQQFCKFIFVFQNGFNRLFEIIMQEGAYDAVVRDCLAVINNAVGANADLQTHLIDSGILNEFPRLMARLLGTSSDTLTPLAVGQSNNNMETTNTHPSSLPLSPAKLVCLLKCLELISHLVTGIADKEQVEEYGGYAFAIPRKRLVFHPDPEANETLRRRRLKVLPDVQTRLGKVTGLLRWVGVAALCLLQLEGEEEGAHGESDEQGRTEIQDTSNQPPTVLFVRSAALRVLGDLCVDHSMNRNTVYNLTILAPPRCLVSECDFGYIADPDWLGHTHAYTRTGLFDGVLRVALLAYFDSDLQAGNYCLTCLMHDDMPGLAVQVLGHTIQRPPAELAMSPNNREGVMGSHGMGVGNEHMKVLESPSAGRVIVDTFVKSAELLLTTTEALSAFWDEDRVMILRYTMWKSGRLLERLLNADNVCKVIALRLSVFPAPDTSTVVDPDVPFIGAASLAGNTQDNSNAKVQQDKTPEKIPLFACMLHQLEAAISQWGQFESNQLTTGDKMHTSQQSNNTSESVHEMNRALIMSQLRVLCAWVDECDDAAHLLTSLPSNAFIFGLAAKNKAKPISGEIPNVPTTSRDVLTLQPQIHVDDINVRGLGALATGLCVASLKKQGQRLNVVHNIIQLVGMYEFEVCMACLQQTEMFVMAKRSWRALKRDGLAHRADMAGSNFYDRQFVESFERNRVVINLAVSDVFLGKPPPEEDPSVVLPGGVKVDPVQRERIMQINQLKMIIRQQDEALRVSDERVAALEALMGGDAPPPPVLKSSAQDEQQEQGQEQQSLAPADVVDGAWSTQEWQAAYDGLNQRNIELEGLVNQWQEYSQQQQAYHDAALATATAVTATGFVDTSANDFAVANDTVADDTAVAAGNFGMNVSDGSAVVATGYVDTSSNDVPTIDTTATMNVGINASVNGVPDTNGGSDGVVVDTDTAVAGSTAGEIVDAAAQQIIGGQETSMKRRASRSDLAAVSERCLALKQQLDESEKAKKFAEDETDRMANQLNKFNQEYQSMLVMMMKQEINSASLLDSLAAASGGVDNTLAAVVHASALLS